MPSGRNERYTEVGTRYISADIVGKAPTLSVFWVDDVTRPHATARLKDEYKRDFYLESPKT